MPFKELKKPHFSPDSSNQALKLKILFAKIIFPDTFPNSRFNNTCTMKKSFISRGSRMFTPSFMKRKSNAKLAILRGERYDVDEKFLHRWFEENLEANQSHRKTALVYEGMTRFLLQITAQLHLTLQMTTFPEEKPNILS